MSIKFRNYIFTVFLGFTQFAQAQSESAPGSATTYTRQAKESVYKELDFSNKEDFELSSRGFIATLADPVIKTSQVPYAINKFDFTRDKEAPDTVHPSLWRQAQLISQHGLFKVTDRVYQIRGFDLANMTLIEGKSGWIVIDPLTASETSAAGLALANEKLGKKPVKAVIFTHSHVDHFGGINGVLSGKEIQSGTVPIVAPEGFLEEAISENLYAGAAMNRRASYMYGFFLPNSPSGSLGTGLGPSVSIGTRGIATPTKLIKKTGEKMNLDGVEIVFQMAPHTEAPAEMMFYFPQFKALCLAEDATSTMHNLYTLRGAKARDPNLWSGALTTTLEMFGKDVQFAFSSHHWPRWGNEKIREFVSDQRDMYKYIKDQTLRLANMGYDGEEIAEMLQLPDALSKKFYNRGYYGSMSHNVKATYQFYLGFFNGNPATLHKYPRVEEAKRYVADFGGAQKFIAVGKSAFDKGDYRWAAEVLNHVVYSDPNSKEARDLLAKTYEQMGYQSENATWRGFYLMGAKELREGKANSVTPLVHPEELPLAMLFDYTSIRVNPDKVGTKELRIGIHATDTKEKYSLVLKNSVLVPSKELPGEKFDSVLELKSKDLAKILTGKADIDDAIKDGTLKVDGKKEVLKDLLSSLDEFPDTFNLVTPVNNATSYQARIPGSSEKAM